MGVWLLNQWIHVGSFREIRVVELGPGRGTLMHDVLRVLSHFRFAQGAIKEVHLVETSPTMRSRQSDKLTVFAKEPGWKLEWHDSIDEIPPDSKKFTMIIAHEFFDALPFHLIRKTDGGWREVLITSAPDLTSSTRFRTVLSPTPTPMSNVLGLSSDRFKRLPIGTQIEVSPAASKVARKIGDLVHLQDSERTGSAGSALIVDYGGEKAYGGSFRAFKDHKIVDIFHRPGECDLTTNVDFAYLKEAAADLAASYGPVSQATFLTRMGIKARVDALKRGANSEDRKKEIEMAAQRLVDPTGMGIQYQVMSMIGARGIEPTVEERWPFVETEGP
ncbi:hypothetical protein AcV5_008230 [Taiwanofungus camphoratus]|nr:hypothetical protein AcV5_008230 [Antrodia cinnamomea]